MEQSIKHRIIVIDDNQDIYKDFTSVLCRDDSHDEINNLESNIFGESGPNSDTNILSSTSYDLSYASQGKEGVNMIKKAYKDEDPFTLAFVWF